MGALHSSSQECHPFLPSSLAYDLVVSSKVLGRVRGSQRCGGSSEKYHPGLIYHYPGLSVDGGIKFPYSSKDSLLRPERIGGKEAKDV